MILFMPPSGISATSFDNLVKEMVEEDVKMIGVTTVDYEKRADIM